jgi:hypothetical protein
MNSDDGLYLNNVKYADQLAAPLQDLFQSSINTGEVPQDWKDANISAIFKKGSRSCAANYRPVSLTSVVCKALEHVIHSHVMKHLEKHHILTDFQHGFRAKKSTETQLILTVHDISKELNKNNIVDVAVLDFSKAFDKVPHRRLISKLQYYGLSGEISTWVKNFLSGRTQQVVIDGHTSLPAAVTSGVPQGTVTGPLWFLLYINDLPNNITSQTRLFADDCLIYKPIVESTDTSILQKDLELLETWQDTWLMNFNPSKCCTMTIGKRNSPHHEYKFCDQVLDCASSQPYLGVHISNTLSWDKHIQETIKKAQRVQNVIRRNLWSCNREVKTTAYLSLVRPLLEYASSVWDPSFKKDINALERVQRQAARFCMGNYKREPGTVTKLLKDLEWDTLQTRRKRQKLCMLFKMQNGLVDIPLLDYVQPSKKETRGNNQKFIQVSHKARAFQDSFFVSTIKDWNQLKCDAVNCPSLETFKTKIQNMF